MPERSLYGWWGYPTDTRLAMPEIKNLTWVPDPATRVTVVQHVRAKTGRYRILSHTKFTYLFDAALLV